MRSLEQHTVYSSVKTQGVSVMIYKEILSDASSVYDVEVHSYLNNDNINTAIFRCCSYDDAEKLVDMMLNKTTEIIIE